MTVPADTGFGRGGGEVGWYKNIFAYVARAKQANIRYLARLELYNTFIFMIGAQNVVYAHN